MPRLSYRQQSSTHPWYWKQKNERNPDPKNPILTPIPLCPPLLNLKWYFPIALSYPFANALLSHFLNEQSLRLGTVDGTILTHSSHMLETIWNQLRNIVIKLRSITTVYRTITKTKATSTATTTFQCILKASLLNNRN